MARQPNLMYSIESRLTILATLTKASADELLRLALTQVLTHLRQVKAY